MNNEIRRLKARQARLRWYGHVLRMDKGNEVKQTMPFYSPWIYFLKTNPLFRIHYCT